MLAKKPRMAQEMDLNVVHRPVFVPPPACAEVWLDFDGTLTKQDVVDTLIRRFADSDAWRDLENAWQAGRIGSRACLSGQFALLQIDEPELDRFLDSIELDAGAPRLLSLLRQHDVPVTVVSDGIDWFIERIFRSHRIVPPPVRSNSLMRDGQTWRLVCPHSSSVCPVGAAHCKCSSIERLNDSQRQRVYVGDGMSDLCAAKKAHVRFAKGTLATKLADERIDFIRFNTLYDVCAAFEATWSRSRSRAA
jgi:2-hydroxy-3-keto-5-methylthiopentenyl-1-phosphate phosphatase